MINTNGIELIKKYEGCRLQAYFDSVGIPTIGYGRTKNVKIGDTCSLAQATAWLLEDIEDAENIVNEYVTAKITENQRAALTSFVYNIGAGVEGEKDGLCELKDGGQSHLLIYTNMGAFGKAADQFLLWAKAGGVTVMGLIRRRTDERTLYLTP